MPRIVVPRASPLVDSFIRRSSSKCQGKITWARVLTMRFLETWMPRVTRLSISCSKAGRIDDHAGRNDALHVGPKNAAGDQRELERLPVHDDGVPGVGPALVANDDIVPLGEKIDDLPLGFITPLQPNDTRGRHDLLSI